MTDPDGAGWPRERAWAVPVYEDHLVFLRDLALDGDGDGDAERPARPRGRARLRLCLQVAAVATVGVAVIVVIATLAAVAVTVYLCTRAVTFSDISAQSMSRSGVSDWSGWG